MSFSVKLDRTPVQARLLQESYPAIEARPSRIGWSLLQPGSSGEFADIWWRFYVNAESGVIAHGPGLSVEIPAMHLTILPAWTRWRLECPKACSHIFVEVECPQISAALINKQFSGAIRSGQQASDLFIDACLGIYQGAEKPGLSNQLQAAIHLAMSDIAKQCDTGKRFPTILSTCLSYIEAHIADDLRVPKLARELHCSPKHLTNTFNQHLDNSPANYIRQRRIAHACKLLGDSDLSIEQIAEAVGFANRAYLSRVMQQQMHIAPAAYRRQRHN